MLPLAALKSMKVMFVTPCYISGVTMNYVASIFSMTLDSAHLGLNCILHLHSESLITRGRNKIVLKFLSDESFTHLFWIDSDIAFQSESVFRLLRADRDVAAGVYPIKNFHWPAGLPPVRIRDAACPRIMPSAAAGATSAARSSSTCNAI
jgi:hypothetical protein